MPIAFILILAFLGLVFFLRLMAKTPPQNLSKVMKQATGVGALGLAALLFVRGRVEFASAAGALGLWLLGMGQAPAWTKSFKKAGAGGQGTSRVRSAMIEMELDHETGAIEGQVLAGAFEGKRLAALTRPQCEDLYRTCLSDDPEGARLLEAYLDRRFPGWRPAGQSNSDAGAGSGQTGSSAAMTEDEAYEILGLQKGAAREEISRAHRSLMKKLHPDHGGSTGLAARVNQAKDMLMRRHH